MTVFKCGFDPNIYSGGPSSAGPTLVEIATARSFILNRGIVNAPGSRGVADIVSVTMPLLSIKDLAAI